MMYREKAWWGNQESWGRPSNSKKGYPSNVYLGVIAVGWKVGFKPCSPGNIALRFRRVQKACPLYNSMIFTHNSGMHSRIVEVWATYRPTRPVKNPLKWLEGYLCRYSKKKSTWHRIALELYDEGRAI